MNNSKKWKGIDTEQDAAHWHLSILWILFSDITTEGCPPPAKFTPLSSFYPRIKNGMSIFSLHSAEVLPETNEYCSCALSRPHYVTDSLWWMGLSLNTASQVFQCGSMLSGTSILNCGTDVCLPRCNPGRTGLFLNLTFVNEATHHGLCLPVTQACGSLDYTTLSLFVLAGGHLLCYTNF